MIASDPMIYPLSGRGESPIGPAAQSLILKKS
jgi:hypothetical protein